MTRLLFINLERVLNVISQIVEKKLLKKLAKQHIITVKILCPVTL